MRHNRDGERNCYRLFGRFSVFVLLAGGLLLHAETFSEFKRQQEAAYSSYKDRNDRAFAGYLKSQWQAYEKFLSGSLYTEPKPKQVPKTRPRPAPKVGPKILIKISSPVVPKKPELPQNLVVEKPHLKKDLSGGDQTKDVLFDFFGTSMRFDIPKKMRQARFYPPSQKGIANYFDSVAVSEYEPLLQEIIQIKKGMKLNDWGLYLLIDRIGHTMYHEEEEAQLFNWFVFNKLGYAVKVGLANGRVIPMYHSKKWIYATPFFRFGTKKYYLLSYYNKESPKRVYSYKQNYPGATKAFDLSLKTLPLLQPDYRKKRLHFRYLGEKYELVYRYNKNLIDFFATYPQADYATFFNAPVDRSTYASIADSLKKYIDGKHAAEAMNFVLNFVQNAFRYETDEQQFGREKVMFAEETLFYKASDCEDRAILYAFLVKELFGVPVLGIKYPNHMATALNVPLDGDKVRIKGREFVVADPTYINANIGEAMPQFRGKMPDEFIFVRPKK